MLLMPAAEPASKHKKVNLRSASCALRLTFFLLLGYDTQTVAPNVDSR